MEAYRNSSRTTYLHKNQSCYDTETVDTDHSNLDDDDGDDDTNYTYGSRSRSRRNKHTSTSSSPSDNNNNPAGEILTSCTGTINTRSTRIYDNITCPPSLVEQIRQSQQSQSQWKIGPEGTEAEGTEGCGTSFHSIPSINVVLPETPNCIENNFDIVKHSENIQNYKSIAYKFANPCSTIINDHLPGGLERKGKSEYVMHKERQNRQQQQHQHQQQPTTPSTVGSSYSEDDDESQNDNEEEVEPTIESDNKNRPTSMNRSGPSFSIDDDDDVQFPSRFGTGTGTGSDNNNNISNDSSNDSGNDVPTLLLVGDQEYICPSGRGSLTSKYFITQRQKILSSSSSVGTETETTTTYDDNGNSYLYKYYVDLSTHSSQEFMFVKNFLEKWDNDDDDDDDDDDIHNINWNNMHIILPWFVEFQAKPLMNAVDMFLLHNTLWGHNNNNNNNDGGVMVVGGGNGGDGGDSDNNNITSLSNLLLLTQIAFICELETTKLNARKILRRRLLEPRKQNSEVDDSRDGGRVEGRGEVGVGENIELEWTLDDLQTLAQILQSFDDLREYLWEYAIIVYLPHDLDISDSVGLVSNILFPYLLREGMMQMMIVEGIESSFPTSESSFVNNKSQSTIGSSSFSTTELSTTCSSDTTIPTNPSLSFPKRKTLTTQEEIQHHLHNTIEQLEKFQIEKKMRTTASRSSRNEHCPAASVVDDEESLLMGEEINTGSKNRRQRRYNNRATTDSTVNLTFSC